jgi:hypothetical protein
MTAYLQPGDKIHLSVPWSLDDTGLEETQEALKQVYAAQGIELLVTTSSDHRLPVEVISVIRPVAPSFEDWLPPSPD